MLAATRFTLLLKFVASLLLILAMGSGADAETPSAPLDLQLVSEVKSIRQGEPFTVGLHLHHPPGRHTYWKYPGIVGVPTNLTWDLPEGFQAAEIQWEIPDPVSMRGHPAYGYQRDVLLLIDITPPEDLEPGSTIILKTKASWMSCSQNDCFPGFTDLTLSLPVTDQASDWDPEWRDLFQQTRAGHARPIEGWKAEAHLLNREQVSLKLTPDKPGKYPEPEDLRYYSADAIVASNQPHEISRDAAGTYHFILPRHRFGPDNPQTMSGVLISETGGWPNELPALWIEAPILESLDENAAQ